MLWSSRLLGAALLLLSAAVVPHAPAQAQNGCTGSTVVIGGALKDDNLEVWSRIV